MASHLRGYGTGMKLSFPRIALQREAARQCNAILSPRRAALLTADCTKPRSQPASVPCIFRTSTAQRTWGQVFLYSMVLWTPHDPAHGGRVKTQMVAIPSETVLDK
jgi:hypothetical protein